VLDDVRDKTTVSAPRSATERSINIKTLPRIVCFFMGFYRAKRM